MGSAASDGSRRLELRLPATREGFARGFEELRQALDGVRLEQKVRLSVELVFEEVVSNVVRHGARTDRPTTVWLDVLVEPQAVKLLFRDDGIAFDPRERPDPAPPTDLEHAETGGRGLMLIRRVSSALEYARTPEGQNRLTVTVSRG